MITTFEFLVLAYLIIGLITAVNFVYTEKEKKTIESGIVFLFGIFVMLFWPFYILYNDNDDNT